MSNGVVQDEKNGFYIETGSEIDGPFDHRNEIDDRTSGVQMTPKG